MPTIMRRYHFESAHFLPHVPEGHRCRNMHGHNYEMDVTVYSDALDKQGFVLDFAELDKIVQPFVIRLDHSTINDIIENPTAEIIAEWFFNNLSHEMRNKRQYRILRVCIWETKDCCAIFNAFED